MCIAIAVHSGPMIDRGTLEKCWHHNPHGAGFSFVYEGRVRVLKGFMDFESFEEAYRGWRLADVPHLIHFRIKTTGKVDKYNTHPFRISPHVSMIHNGTLDYYSRGSKSDTNSFVTDFLRPITREMGDGYLMEDAGLHAAIEAVMGFSKLAFLDSESNILILNEKSGEWDKDKRIWFSNSSWRREISKPKKSSPNTVPANKRGNTRFSSGPALFNRDPWDNGVDSPFGEMDYVPGKYRFSSQGYMYENEDLTEKGWKQWGDGSWSPPGEIYAEALQEYRNEENESYDDELRELDELRDEEVTDLIPFSSSGLESKLELEIQMEQDAKKTCLRDRHIVQDERNISSMTRADLCRVLAEEAMMAWAEIEQFDDNELMTTIEANGLQESATVTTN